MDHVYSLLDRPIRVYADEEKIKLNLLSDKIKKA